MRALHFTDTISCEMGHPQREGPEGASLIAWHELRYKINK